MFTTLQPIPKLDTHSEDLVKCAERKKVHLNTHVDGVKTKTYNVNFKYIRY